MVTTYTEKMDWQLDAAELRVLGALMEKEKTTPEYYPMSLNALVNACNQKSNRDPVVNSSNNACQNFPMNLRSLSDINTVGSPCNLKILSKKFFCNYFPCGCCCTRTKMGHLCQ